MDLEKDIIGSFDEARYDNKCNPGKLYYKKGSKNEIIRNGDKFSLAAFGFQTFDGNSLIKLKKTNRTIDLGIFYCQIRIVNMKSKENAGKLQLLTNECSNTLKSIRNKVFDRSTVTKSVLEHELIDKKINILENAIKKAESSDFDELSNHGNLTELLDLENLDEEIDDEKLFKREKFKKTKVQSEKKLLYQFEKELKEEKWEKMFKNEKKIVVVLDNARTHISKIGKKIAKILNIKLVFLEKYSSDLNPVERVWYSIKDKLSTIYVEDEMFLMVEFSRYFYIYANSKTLVEKWLDIYIT